MHSNIQWSLSGLSKMNSPVGLLPSRLHDRWNITERRNGEGTEVKMGEKSTQRKRDVVVVDRGQSRVTRSRVRSGHPITPLALRFNL